MDTLIQAEVLLPHGEELIAAKVIRRTLDEIGKVTGIHSDNTILNTLRYNLEFPDVIVCPYAANVIADNIYAQVNSEGIWTNIIDAIIDYCIDGHAVSNNDQYFVPKRGHQHLHKTTAGWKLLMAMKDGSKKWFPLKDLKESNPIIVAEYAIYWGIDDEPAFKWWVPYTMWKRDTIIAAVMERVRVATHKYGIEVLRSIEHAKQLEKKNGNTFWMQALVK